MVPLSVLDSTIFRVCTKCGCTKPLQPLFFRPRYSSNGLFYNQCRACERSQQTIYNRKRLRKPRKAGKSPEEQRDWNKEYLVEWRKNNRDKCREYQRRWVEKNIDRAREHKRVRELKRRARKAQAVGSHDLAIIVQMYDDQHGMCAYCDVPLFGCYQVDHMIPLSRGGSNDWQNLAIVCPHCNATKNTKTAEEFMNH